MDWELKAKMMKTKSPKIVGNDILSFLSKKDTEGRLRFLPLWANWDKIIPSNFIGLVEPLGHKESTLMLLAKDSVVMQELTFLAPQLLDIINTYLKENAFTKVHFQLANGRELLHKDKIVAPRVERNELPEYLTKETVGLLPEDFAADSIVGESYKKYKEIILKEIEEKS